MPDWDFENLPPIDPAFIRLADQWTDLATGLGRTNSLGPAEGSQAAEDRDSLDFTGLGYNRPALEVALLPARLLGHASDHLHALGAVLRTPGCAFSAISLLRPPLESAARACWLASGADRRERVRRWAVLQLHGLASERRLIGREEAASDLAIERRVREEELLSKAREYGFKPAKCGKGAPEGVQQWCLDKPEPSALDQLSALYERCEMPSLAKFLQRFTSAVVHGQLHGLNSLIGREHARETEDEHVLTAPTVLTLQSMLTYSLALLAGLEAAIRAVYIDYYGVKPIAWWRVHDPALHGWARAAFAPERCPPRTHLPDLWLPQGRPLLP